MIAAFGLARSSCRGTLWKTLQSKPQILGCGAQHKIVFKSKDFVTRPKQTAHFSTSQIVNATAQAHDHNHSRLWTAERFLSASLVGLLPASLVFPNPVLDYALALALTAHIHWGVEAIVVDYARPKVVGEALAKVALFSVYALTALTLGGLFYFNYTDVGLSQAIRMLWKL